MADVLGKVPPLNHKTPASSIARGSPIELINTINKATEIYDLNDEEIYRLQRYGLSSIDASQYPATATEQKDLMFLKKKQW